MKLAAIVLCAGEGTRMNSTTSKMLHKVCGRPLCLWTLDLAAKIANQEIIAVVGHGKDLVQSTIAERFGDRVVFAIQEEQLGTGDAVKCAIDKISDSSKSVLVLCGDTPLISEKSLQKLVHLYETHEKPDVAMFTTELENPHGYGRVIRDENGAICSVVEQKELTGSDVNIKEINPGVYIFSVKFLRETITSISNANTKREYYLTDLIKEAYKRVELSSKVVSVIVASTEMLGINDRVQLAKAENELRARIAGEWMVKGVSFRDPKTAYIEPSVEIAADVTIEPNVYLKGNTKIERGATIGMGCIIDNTRVGENVVVHPYCVCENATIRKNASIGPFARLRIDSDIGEEARIGNFVEVKNSVFGYKAKANHLAYIGDASIGEACNVGAGTITCNYDGFAKNKTNLGKGVFVGSNCTLVAPLDIGEGAYLAAGSTITSEVKKDDLAIGRARQSNKSGYAKKVRDKLQSRKNKN